MVSRSSSMASATLRQRSRTAAGAWSRPRRRTPRPRPRPRRRRRRASLAATSSSSSPVAGLRTSSVWPDLAARQVPPMKFSCAMLVLLGRSCSAIPRCLVGNSTMLVASGVPGKGFRNETCRSQRLPCATALRGVQACRPGEPAPGEAPCVGGDTTTDDVIQLERVTKRFGQFVAVHDADFGIARGEFFSMLGPVRLRQDHDPAHDRRVRAALRGRDPPRGQRRLARPALQAQRQHRLPAVRAVPAHVGLGQRRVRAEVAEGRRRRDQAPRRRAARDRPPLRLRAPQAEPALRRPAAAGRARPRARQLPERAAARRAARRARPQAAPGDAARAQAHPARGRHHVRVRDARPGRGAHDERPHRGDERRAASSRSARRARSTTSRRRCSSPASSATPTCSRSRWSTCDGDLATGRRVR